MKEAFPVRFSILIIGLFIVILPRDADAEASNEHLATAQEHDRLAMERFEQGDYVGALREMQAAQSLVPSTVRLYNMGRCHERLGRRPEAIDLYERFLAADDVPEERRQVVGARLSALRDELGQSVEEPPGEGDVSPDEQDPTAEEVNVEPEPTAVETPDPSPSSRQRLSPVAFYSALGVTLASGVALAVLGGVTVARHNEFKELTRDSEEATNLAAQGDRLIIANNVLMGVTISAALATVVLAIFTRWRSDDTSSAQRALTLGFGGTNVALTGRF